MASLNQADAVIFDLRDNRGGEPKMVALIAAYLFDHPEYLYNPREETARQSWTPSPVPGNKLADKPVYVLTSSLNIFRRRAVQLRPEDAETRHACRRNDGWRRACRCVRRIDDHFGIGIPEAKAINPFSTVDWAGVGVEPDVKVKAADALETAEKLAENRLRKK